MSVDVIKKQSDGKILVGGYFSGSFQSGSIQNFVRLDQSGSVDPTFNIGSSFDSTVRAIAVQNDGNILVGGDFSSYNGTFIYYIARLDSSGSLNTASFSNTNSPVQAIAIQNDGKILIGGSFNEYSGSSVNRIVRLNTSGSIDDTFNIGTGFNDGVRDIQIQPDGKILCGGDFSEYSGSTARSIARLNTDGTLDTTFNHGDYFKEQNANPAVIRTIALQDDGNILVGGFFTIYSSGSLIPPDLINPGTTFGYLCRGIARLDASGSFDKEFANTVGEGFWGPSVFKIKIYNNHILVGGTFGYYQGYNTINFVKLTMSGSIYETFPSRIKEREVEAPPA